MRARRGLAQAWERACARPYLYAGVGKGANVAAWKQAARAELAATMRHKVGYAQVLLDLVKAFDRIPHWLLIREAIALEFPLWHLKLAIATYKLTRVLRIGATISDEVVAVQGITAGSGSACTEMRLCMIRIVDRAWAVCPMVTPTLFVDDLSMEMAAPDVRIIEEVGKCIRIVAQGIKEAGMELSGTKSLCSASTKALADTLCKGWKEEDDVHIQVQMNVKSLGAGLGAGRRRNTAVQEQRLAAFKKRTPKFRRLVKLGIKTDRIVRTGGTAGMGFGQAIAGVSNSTSQWQKRVVGATTAPQGAAVGKT